MELEEVLRKLRSRKRPLLMPHVYYGDPNEVFSQLLLKTLVESGADILEVGIPYSDPIADGPTFIASCERALKSGITPPMCLQGIRRLREEGADLPIVLTTYFNIIYTAGVEEFLRKARSAGVQALIVPDLPFEEAGEMMELTRRQGMDFILQVSPSTNQRRLERILSSARGFIYVINVEGVTGSREVLPPSTFELIKRVREKTDIPIFVGFGISRKEHVKMALEAGADGVVVGSAIANIYSENLSNPYETLPKIADFLKDLVAI